MKVTNIRFNLKFFNADGGEEVVRTLADLRSKFNLCDLWDYFNSGALVRWLRSIDELMLATSVESLAGSSDGYDSQPTMQKLCEMLGLSVQDDEIAEMCEVLGFHERTRDWHEKMGNLRAQSKMGTITSTDEAGDILSLENQCYSDDFNYIMDELRKLDSNANIDRLKAFEQKFVTFLNHWGRIFICDFANKLFQLRLACSHADNLSVFVMPNYTPQYKLDCNMIFLIALIAVNKRWASYLCYGIGDGMGLRKIVINCEVCMFDFLSSEKPIRPFPSSFLEAVTFEKFNGEVYMLGLNF